MYQNDEPIPVEKLKELLRISFEIEYKHDWEEGGLILIDNYLVSYGRNPWYEGDRIIYVSMRDSTWRYMK